MLQLGNNPTIDPMAYNESNEHMKKYTWSIVEHWIDGGG